MAPFARPLRDGLGRLRSVSITYKILGIGLLVTGIFGVVTLVETRGALRAALYGLLEQRAMGEARSLAAKLSHPIATNDELGIQQIIAAIRQQRIDVSYVIVREPAGRPIAHTFERAIPRALSEETFDGARRAGLRIMSLSDGALVFEATAPVLRGHGGWVQFGLSDHMVIEEIASLTRSVLSALAICIAIGAVLGLALTWRLTDPIARLIELADRIRGGELGARAAVESGDEIGRLTETINEMSGALAAYQAQAREKERARQALLERVVQVQEDERASLSRELHDHLGPSLLAVILRLERERGGPAAAWVQDVQEQLRGIVDGVRRLARGMRPGLLDDYGLDLALRRHIEELDHSATADIDYQYLSTAGADRLRPSVEVALYRIAQEALTNALRHAVANRISVVLLRDSQQVTLLVEDDGCGFDPATIDRYRGVGLTGMEERVALLGGQLHVESEAGRGSVVRASIPLEEA